MSSAQIFNKLVIPRVANTKKEHYLIFAFYSTLTPFQLVGRLRKWRGMNFVMGVPQPAINSSLALLSPYQMLRTQQKNTSALASFQSVEFLKNTCARPLFYTCTMSPKKYVLIPYRLSCGFRDTIKIGTEYHNPLSVPMAGTAQPFFLLRYYECESKEQPDDTFEVEVFKTCLKNARYRKIMLRDLNAREREMFFSFLQ